MDNLFIEKVPLYYEAEKSQLILGDIFKILVKMKRESVDMIFADPPYFLSNDGITCQGGKIKAHGIGFRIMEPALKKNISLTENGLIYVRKF